MDATLAWYSFESKETLWKIGKQATSATSATGSGLNKSVSLQHRLPEELACLGHQDPINIPSEPSPSRHSCFKSEVQFFCFPGYQRNPWLPSHSSEAMRRHFHWKTTFQTKHEKATCYMLKFLFQQFLIAWVLYESHFVNSQASSLGAAQFGHSRGCAATSKRRRTCWVFQWTNADDSQNAELKTSWSILLYISSLRNGATCDIQKEKSLRAVL